MMTMTLPRPLAMACWSRGSVLPSGLLIRVGPHAPQTTTTTTTTTTLVRSYSLASTAPSHDRCQLHTCAAPAPQARCPQARRFRLNPSQSHANTCPKLARFAGSPRQPTPQYLPLKNPKAPPPTPFPFSRQFHLNPSQFQANTCPKLARFAGSARRSTPQYRPLKTPQTPPPTPCQFRRQFHLNPPQSLHLAPPFLVHDHEPAALTAQRRGLLPAKVEAARQELESCRACPRDCKVNRLKDRQGACHTGRHALVSSAFAHFGEESVLQGWNGSGTIFFGMCNLRCVFCQNWDISQKKSGWELGADEIADLMLKLQNETKCHNINLVTPEHVVPQVVEAIAAAVQRGLSLPIVYNTSAYDSPRSLRLLDGLVDVYMPDFKFWAPESSERLCKARDYPSVARSAIREMHRQVGDLAFDEHGLARRGLLLRHLVMPSYAHESKRIMRFVAEDVSRDTYVHVMEQYRPAFNVGKGEQRARHGFTKYEEIDRPVQEKEVDEVRSYARELGLWRFEDHEWLPGPQG